MIDIPCDRAGKGAQKPALRFQVPNPRSSVHFQLNEYPVDIVVWGPNQTGHHDIPNAGKDDDGDKLRRDWGQKAETLRNFQCLCRIFTNNLRGRCPLPCGTA
jgi:hypothetical protein